MNGSYYQKQCVSFLDKAEVGILALLLLAPAFIDITTSVRPPNTPIAYTRQFLALAFGVVLLLILRILQNKNSIYAALKQPVALIWLSVVLVKISSTFLSGNIYFSLWGSYLTWTDGVYYSLILYFELIAVLSVPWNLNKVKTLTFFIFAQALLLSLLVYWETYSGGISSGRVRAWSSLANSDYYLSYTFVITPIVLGITYWLIINRAKTRLIIGSLVSTLVVLLSAYLCLPEYLRAQISLSRTEGDTGSLTETVYEGNNERAALWNLGYTLAKDNYLTGVGPGNVASSAWGYPALGKGITEGAYVNRIHNETTEYFVEYGLIGGVSYVIFWLFLFIYGVLKVRKAKKTERYIIVPIYVGLLLFFLFNQLLYITPVAGSVAFLLIAVVSQTNGVQISNKDTGKRRVFLLLVFLLLVVSVQYLGWQEYRKKITIERNIDIADKIKFSDQGKTESLLLEISELKTGDPLYYYHASRLYNTLAWDKRRLREDNKVYKVELSPEKQGVFSRRALLTAEEALHKDPQNTLYKLQYLLTRLTSKSYSSDEEKVLLLKNIEKTFSEAPDNWKSTFFKAIRRAYAIDNSGYGIQSSLECIIKMIPESDKERITGYNENYLK